MDIKVGKFRLTSDERQIIVCHQKRIKLGKNKGDIVDQDFTYHPTLESAFQNLLNRKVLASKATTIKELIEDLNKYKREIKKVLNMTLTEED